MRRITDFGLLEGIKSYKDAKVRLPFFPILASGCNESSSTWYSNPIAEPVLFSVSVTKYFTPLFAPGVNLNSNERSKALYSPVVTISPPSPPSLPFDSNTVMVPLVTFQSFSGKVFLYAPLQPLEVFPSNNNFHPFCFS